MRQQHILSLGQPYRLLRQNLSFYVYFPWYFGFLLPRLQLIVHLLIFLKATCVASITRSPAYATNVNSLLLTFFKILSMTESYRKGGGPLDCGVSLFMLCFC